MPTSTFTSPSPSPIFNSPTSPFKKQKMSITQTYYLAHKARAKLSHEAAMPDHNLRLLVGHANLLDGLMLELADAEREQESWFNNSVRSAAQSDKKASPAESSRHIQWADAIPEEDEEDDYEDSSSDDDSDISEDDDEDVEMADVVSLRRVPSNINKAVPASPKMEVVEIDMEDYEEDDYEDEDYAELTLTRSPSHSVISPPPELEHDLDESSEDESMPPSPPTALLSTFVADEKQQQQQEHEQQKASEHQTADLFDDSIHYMPTRNPARLVTAISVY